MDLEEQVKAIDKKVTSILHLLNGTDLDKSQGFLHEFKREKDENDKLEARVSKLERLKDKAIWIMVGTSLPASYGIAKFLGSIIDYLLKK